jgi:transposase InsO family protein
MEWLSISEMIGLPGLPSSKRGINKKANKDNWRSRPRTARGGGLEYHISSLPAETQQYLAKINSPDKQNFVFREGVEEMPNAQYEDEAIREQAEIELPNVVMFPAAKTIVTPMSGVGNDSERAMANVQIQLAFEKFLVEQCSVAGLKKVDCEYAFCQCYANRDILFPKDVDVYRIFPSISRSKLCRDRKILKEKGTLALAGNYGQRRGCCCINNNPEMQSVILGMILKSSTEIHAELAKRFEDAPSLPTVTRWVRGWKDENIQLWTILKEGKTAFNSRFRAAYGDADQGITRVNQRWEMDSTKGDIFNKDGKRYCLLRVIDVFSRRIRTYVAPTTSSNNYLQGLLYQTFLDWGIPEEIRTDRGLAEISSLVQMAFLDLGIHHHICNAYSPWEKPFVERSLNTRALLSGLPGFCGANVLEQRQIRERGDNDVEMRLTPEELQNEIDKWTLKYENTPHRGFDGTDRQGKTPLEAWISSPGAIRKVSTEQEKQALSLLLSDVPHGGGLRIVQKKGIQIGRGTWYADLDGKWVNYIGKQVLCKYSPCGDAGIVNVFEVAPNGGLGKFLFTATNAELLGENRAEKAATAREKQRDVNAAARQLKKLAKTVASEKVDRPMAEVIPLFPLEEEFKNAALEFAVEAVEAVVPAMPKEPTPEERREIAAERQKLEQRELKRMPLEDPGDRYRRLWFTKQKGGDLTDQDISFMQLFETMPEGRVMKRTLESKGIFDADEEVI